MQTRSRTVEMPSGLSLPLAVGMNTRLIGSRLYVSFRSASASSASHRAAPERPPGRQRESGATTLITQWGFPCCVGFLCVHAAATTPVQRTGVLLAQTCPAVSAFPDSTIGSACTSTFSRFAQRLLALRPAHSRSHQTRDRYPAASDISSPPCLPRLLPAR